MPAASRSSARRRRVVTLLTVATLAVGIVGAPAAIAGTGYRTRMLHLINASRDRSDLRAVKLRVSLSAEATIHSRKMILQDRVFDPHNLQQILAQYRWTHLGAAAAGCAATLGGLHRAFMRSPEHRSILLNSQVRWVGIGVARSERPNTCGRGSFWATELFYG